MRVSGHLAAALPLAAGLWWLAGGEAAAMGAAASVLVDLDHAADYLCQRAGPLRPGEFLRRYNAHRVRYLWLVLHSWELLSLAWLGWGWLQGGPRLGALLAGWSWHLVCDQMGNRVGPWLYFLIHRACHRFRRERLACPQPEES